MEIIVPTQYHVMGAIGAALLAQDRPGSNGHSRFRGFEIGGKESQTSSFECPDCPNTCEIVEVFIEREIVARWGDRCGKWQLQEVHPPH